MDDALAAIRTASLVAFGLAAVVLVVAWQPWRRGKPLAGGLWGGALALGGAYLAGQLLIDSWPASFVAAKDKVLIVVGVASLLGLFYSLLPPALESWRLRAVPVLALLIYLFEAQITHTGVRWLAYLTVGGVAFWWLLDDIAERAPGPSAPLTLIPPAAASAPILFWAGQTTIPFCLAPLLVALGVCAIIGCINRSFSLARGGTTVMALLLITIWLIGYFLTDVAPPFNLPLYLLLLAAPTAVVWLTCLGPFRRLSWWSGALLRFILVAAPAAVAVKLAHDNRPPDILDLAKLPTGSPWSRARRADRLAVSAAHPPTTKGPAMPSAHTLSRRTFLSASAAALGTLAAPAARAASPKKKLVLLAGHPSHGPMEHEFNAGVRLLAKCLVEVPELHVTNHRDGWPDTPRGFDGADGILIYADGGLGHPFLQDDRLRVVGDLMRRGVGLMCAHYAVEVPRDHGGKEFEHWIGGYYENLWSCNPMWTPDYRNLPRHPITRGVRPFAIRDEWYMSIRFRPGMKGVQPILSAKPSDAVRDGPYVYPRGPYKHVQAARGRTETMMWAVERPDGGRGVGFTGGHFHKNWKDDNFRKVVLNALLWISHVEVPRDGVASAVTEADLRANLDPKGRRKG